jgi:2-iminoacetate synthase ThiH
LILIYDNEILKLSFRIIPVPKYALDVERLSDDTPVRELVMTHADRVRISPVHGCSYHCSFCTNNAAYYKEISREQLAQAFNVALNDPYNKPRHVLISGGTPNEEVGSYEWINDIYHFFPRKYPQFDFDVMLSPRGMRPEQTSAKDYDDFLTYLHDECGIKTLSINLELYNDRFRERFVPNKASVGKDNYYRFIRKAVEIFGTNSIRSSLVVGLESAEDTLNGVRAILDCGCLPVLSAFVPDPSTDMANYPAPSVEFLLDVVRKADKLAREANLQLGPLCRPCTHNSITVEAGEIII